MILPPVRPPSPKCRLSLKAVGGACCHGTVRHELSGALTDYGHFNNLAFLKSPLQSAVNYFPSQFITSCLLWTCPAFTNCNCLFFFLVVGGLIITLAQLYPWIIQGHLEDKPDQQLDRAEHLTSFCWIDFFFFLQQPLPGKYDRVIFSLPFPSENRR